MSYESSTESVPEDRRKAIFLAVVEAQDKGKSVKQSRLEATAQFNVTEEQVKSIEREGLENNWPPL